MFFDHSKVYKAVGQIEFKDSDAKGMFIINDEVYSLKKFKHDTVNKTQTCNLFLTIYNCEKKFT